MSSALLAASLVAGLVGQGFAGDFSEIAKVSMQDLENLFLEELAVSSSNSSRISPGKTRLLDLEAILRPMFNAVPQESDGTLSHSVVRYVLHRFFVRHYGWFIHGLEPGREFTNSTAGRDAEAHNTSSGVNPSKAALQNIDEWVPSYLQKFLESITDGRGVNLQQLSVFVATLQDLVHKEETGHLHKAYATLWLEENELLDRDTLYKVLQTYMMIYMLGGNFTITSPRMVDRCLELFAQKVANWGSTLSWVRQVQNKVQIGDFAQFSTAAKVVEEIGERYRVFNDGECTRLKAELMSMESQKPGRIRLSDFYKKGLAGVWEFNEKIDYLRSAGLLDETDPQTPLLLLPNYRASRPNCLASSSFYSVCCRNECEDLMEKLEQVLNSSTARPPQVAKLVSSLSTGTVVAPRNLSKILMQRLHEVAATNHGEVPIYGRLFAQWMHHAFPRECPYPHTAGMVSSLAPDEWMVKTGATDSKASKEEMLSMISNETCKFAPRGIDCGGRIVTAVDDEDLPWDTKEELLIVRDQKPPVGSGYYTVFPRNAVLRPVRDVACWLSFVAVAWMVSALCRKAKSEKTIVPSWKGALTSSKGDRACD